MIWPWTYSEGARRHYRKSFVSERVVVSPRKLQVNRIIVMLVSVKDEDVTSYGLEIGRLLESLGTTSIDTFDMDEMFDALNSHYLAEKLKEEIRV